MTPLLALLSIHCGGSSATGGGQDAGTDASGPTCFVDAPCRPGQDKSCVSLTEYVRLVSYPCSHTCGDEPCSGGTCEPEGDPTPCPPGEICVPGDGIAADRCAPPDTDCGGGFCREDSSHLFCGLAFTPVHSASCTTDDWVSGVCCVPAASCGPEGYCSVEPSCYEGFVMTQMGCDSTGEPGSCCIPED